MQSLDTLNPWSPNYGQSPNGFSDEYGDEYGDEYENEYEHAAKDGEERGGEQEGGGKVVVVNAKDGDRGGRGGRGDRGDRGGVGVERRRRRRTAEEKAEKKEEEEDETPLQSLLASVCWSIVPLITLAWFHYSICVYVRRKYGPKGPLEALKGECAYY